MGCRHGGGGDSAAGRVGWATGAGAGGRIPRPAGHREGSHPEESTEVRQSAQTHPRDDGWWYDENG